MSKMPSIMEAMEITSRTGCTSRNGTMVSVPVENAWNEYKDKMKEELGYEIKKKDEEDAFWIFSNAVERAVERNGLKFN